MSEIFTWIFGIGFLVMTVFAIVESIAHADAEMRAGHHWQSSRFAEYEYRKLKARHEALKKNTVRLREDNKALRKGLSDAMSELAKAEAYRRNP